MDAAAHKSPFGTATLRPYTPGTGELGAPANDGIRSALSPERISLHWMKQRTSVVQIVAR